MRLGGWRHAVINQEAQALQAATSAAGVLAVFAALSLAQSCTSPRPRPATAPTSGGASELAYRPAPDLAAVQPMTGGRLELTGTAAPGAAVRLMSPEGTAIYSGADPRGGWRLALPASAQPRLLSLSMSDQGRTLWALGYIFITPDGHAVRLRSGGGSLVAAAGGGLKALALDYDLRRAATLSGMARPGETVRLSVDGAPRGEAHAEADGRFVLALNEPLSPGSHAFALAGHGAKARFSTELDGPGPLSRSPFAAARSDGGWRIDWRTPTGGEQTTLMLAGQAGPA
jgi:hypothetical protein